MKRKEQKKVICLMDGIDWEHHLANDPSGTKLFPNEEALFAGKECLANNGGCGIVEVEVRLIRWVEEQNYMRHVK